MGPDGHGKTALAFITENRTEIVAPEHTIARNQAFPAALQRFLGKGIGAHSFELRIATTTTKLVRTSTPAIEAPLCRGSSLVPTETQADENRALALATGIASWMTANMDREGRLPYLWYTSEDRVSILEDNAIRRFLAAGALGRFAAWQGDPDLLDAYQRHLVQLIGQYLEPLDDGLAVIADSGQASLGAASIAGLAILAGPAADRDQRVLGMLLAAVRASTDEFQGFRTYFYPADRDPIGWEFFSGEALLFLTEATRLEIDGAPDFEELLVLYRRCRDRWHENRHVAFVSWHSQALASLYRLQPLAEIAEFVFELNDWLLPLQRTDPAEPERVGEFGDPLRPHHGSPHASSTGVYLEGLADARDLARAIGDEDRTRRYTTAIDLGLRSLRQLQFRDWRCTWYLSRPDAVLGALRSNLDNNQLRIDNCGHALAAAVKLLDPQRLPVATSFRSSVAMESFTCLATGLDIHPIHESLALNEDAWHISSARQQTIRSHRDTQSIFLRQAIRDTSNQHLPNRKCTRADRRTTPGGFPKPSCCATRSRKNSGANSDEHSSSASPRVAKSCPMSTTAPTTRSATATTLPSRASRAAASSAHPEKRSR